MKYLDGYDIISIRDLLTAQRGELKQIHIQLQNVPQKNGNYAPRTADEKIIWSNYRSKLRDIKQIDNYLRERMTAGDRVINQRHVRIKNDILTQKIINNLPTHISVINLDSREIVTNIDASSADGKKLRDESLNLFLKPEFRLFIEAVESLKKSGLITSNNASKIDDIKLLYEDNWSNFYTLSGLNKSHFERVKNALLNDEFATLRYLQTDNNGKEYLIEVDFVRVSKKKSIITKNAGYINIIQHNIKQNKRGDLFGEIVKPDEFKIEINPILLYDSEMVKIKFISEGFVPIPENLSICYSDALSLVNGMSIKRKFRERIEDIKLLQMIFYKWHQRRENTIKPLHIPLSQLIIDGYFPDFFYSSRAEDEIMRINTIFFAVRRQIAIYCERFGIDQITMIKAQNWRESFLEVTPTDDYKMQFRIAKKVNNHRNRIARRSRSRRGDI